MKLSNEIKAYFVKDFDLPIQVVKDPYFEYYIDLFDNQFQSKKKLGYLIQAIEMYGGEDLFHKSVHIFTDSVIEHIKTNPAYKDFNEQDMSSWRSVFASKKGDIYSDQFIGQYLVSIDMKEANFQSLKYFNNCLVDNTDTYKAFAAQFTDVPYMLESKKIRQVIFGNLNPSRQQTIQKYLISLLVGHFIKNGINEHCIKSTSSDEVVIQTQDLNKITSLMNEIKNDFHELNQIRFSINPFTLKKLGTENYSFFVKVNEENQRMEIKGVNSAYMPEVIKFIDSKPITDFDRLFYLDGRLCSFNTDLF